MISASVFCVIQHMQIPKGPLQPAAPTGIVNILLLYLASCAGTKACTEKKSLGKYSYRQILALAIIMNELGNEQRN